MGGECGRTYPSTSITRFVDVAHAARADLDEDFVGTQTTPTGKGHLVEYFYFIKSPQSPHGGLRLGNALFGMLKAFQKASFSVIRSSVGVTIWPMNGL
jgi:hypothetical protein